MSRHRETILRAADRIEPKWIGKTIEAYHTWLRQLSERPTKMSAWTLLRPRLGQILLEILFISGLLIFSRALLAEISNSVIGTRMERDTIEYIFWGAVAVLVLVPLVSIWRNFAALAMICSEAWESSWLPRIAIERALKAIILFGLVTWLYLVLPRASFSQWGWVIIAAGATIVVAVFSRRLIFLHSHWQSSMKEVLADNRANAGEMRAEARATLGKDLSEWNVILAESTVPNSAPYIGRTLASLSIPSRFSCSVIEISRNGHSIPAPPSDFALYGGDTLLLMGEPAQIATARKFLEAEAESSVAENGAESAVLDTCQVAGPRVGSTLAELQVTPRTGVRVVGIQRGARRIVNPTADERLEDGDDLLVLGTMSKIRQFRQWLIAGRN
jgi:CPA2 family monovalent cation:H+ antiporter-2